MIICVTGIPGSGKSTVARLLKPPDGLLIDMDRLGRQATHLSRGAIESAFGKGFFDEKGELLPGKLGRYLFVEHPEKIPAFNRIVHPVLKSLVTEAIEKNRHAEVLIIDGALILELGLQRFCDVLIVVTAPIETAARRFVERTGYPESAFWNILKHQMPQAEKARRADWVIDNSGGLDKLKAQVDAVKRTVGLLKT